MGYIQNNRSNNLAFVDKNRNALRTTLMPDEIVGSYRASLVSSTITFSNISSANGVLYTFKYSGTGVCILKTVRIGLQIIATGFTTTARPAFSIYRVPTDFTQGTTGGTLYGVGGGITLSTKKRTSMPTPDSSIVIYASGAGITGDTASTEDILPLGRVLLGGAAGSVTTFPQAGLRGFFTAERSADAGVDLADMTAYPIILAPNEGLRIKNDVAFIGGTTGAGTAALVVTIEWDEATVF